MILEVLENIFQMQITSNIEILLKSRNFGQKSKFWSKVESLAKGRNFAQRSKF